MPSEPHSPDPSEIRSLAMANYGHFTTMRVEASRVRALRLHLERLRRDCHAVFDTELDIEQVRARILEAVHAEPAAVTVRVTVFDPGLGVERPGADARPRILVTTRPAPTDPPPLRVRTAVHYRNLPVVKHTGLFGVLHERRLAQRAGFDDVLLTDAERVVAEGATWNIGFFDGSHLVWPVAEMLPGITMQLLRLHHAGEQRYARVDTAMLRDVEAAFATNSAVGVRPVAAIDDVTYDPDHPFLRKLAATYQAIDPEQL